MMLPANSRVYSLLLLFSIPASAAFAAKPVALLPIDLDEAASVSYEKDIVPILNKHCFECHKPDNREGGLDVTSMAAMLRGGKELGPSILPGRSDKSPLVNLLIGIQKPVMPKEAKPLSQDEVHLLRQWIAAGAKDDSVTFTRDDEALFEKQIRPVLHNRCLKCHAGVQPESDLDLSSRSGVLKGGSRGPAVSLERPDTSLLIKAIRHEGELKMPFRALGLTDDEIAAFETWIRMGLPWPREHAVLTRTRIFNVTDKDRDHWAFRPLAKPERKSTTATPIDAILSAKLKEAGLTFSPLADKHALLRRVTYDLIGYPPTADEIEAFVNDESGYALNKVVDRLLESPHFGKRWGRHWLDYSRLGANPPQPKTGRIEFDYDRYEDWVTDCFNRDLPYDWFAQVHLAGDLLPSPDGDEFSEEQALAATVPLWGPRTVIDISKEPFVLMDKLDESVEFFGRSLLGVSFECSRCHDHKTDPFSQQDYYALLGIFRSSWIQQVPQGARSRADIARYFRESSEQKKRSSDLRAELGKARAELTKGRQFEDRSQEFFNEYVYQGQLWYLEASSKLAEHMAAEARAAGDSKLAAAETANVDGFRKSLAVKKKAGRQTYSKLDQRDLERTIGQLQPKLSGIESFTADLARLADVKSFMEKSKAEKRRAINFRDYGGYAKDAPEVAHIVKLEEQIVKLGAIARQPMLLVRSEGGLGGKQGPKRGEPLIGDSVLYVRGDVVDPGPVIPRRFPVLFSGDNQTPIGDQTTGSGRLQLAQWLTETGSRQQALLARTAVNRVWQHLLGQPLCRTPMDLGRDGDQPVHPQLIDYLAARFIEQDWSVKKLVKEIVLTDAYRQSSLRDERRRRLDPENRLVSSQTMHRLDAEAIENTLAAVAFGRPDSPDKSTVPRGELIIGFRLSRGTGQRTKVKLSLADAIAAIVKQHDAPNPNQILDVRRASLVPTQSLMLMNGDLIRPLCDAITKQVRVESATETETIERLYLQMYGRPATPADHEFANRFLKTQREDKTSETTPIQALIHLMLCSNEFIYVD